MCSGQRGGFFAVLSCGGFFAVVSVLALFILCSLLSRTHPARPRKPPNCFDDMTAPVLASTITFVVVFFSFGMMLISYCVRPSVTFISPEPTCPGTAQRATIFAESGEMKP